MSEQWLNQRTRSHLNKSPVQVVQGTCEEDCPVRNCKFHVLAILFALLTLLAPSSYAGETKQLFRIGTGGLTGVYYPVGKLIALGLTESGEGDNATEAGAQGVPGYIGVAQNSAGSLENVRAVVSGEIQAGLVQADVASWAFESTNVFAGDEKVRSIRAVASLYPEKLQIVTRRDANVRGVPDLRGKRISIDEPGSGTLSVARIVLEAHSLSEKDLLPVYLKPVFTQEKMINGELQGFVLMAGVPAEAYTRISHLDLSLVPISPEIAMSINERFPYLVPGEIPADVYRGVPKTPTLQVHALLVVDSATSDDLVYQVTTALWSDRTHTLLKGGHPQGQAIALKTALEGISIPLHPGAQRFYRERDMLSKEAPKQ